MTTKPLSLLLVVLPLAACAPSAYRADAGVVTPYLNGGISLQNSGGSHDLSEVQNNLRSALGVGESQTQPDLRLEVDWGPQRVRVHGFAYDDSGTGRLDHAFGDLPAGTDVDTTLDYWNIVGSWSWDLMPTATFRLGPGVQLGFYGLDITARSLSPSGFEQIETDLIAPQLFVDGGIDLGPVSLDANLGFMSADLGDAAGRYVDAEAVLRVRLGEQLELFGGYRMTVLDALGEASGRDFDEDVTIAGWMFGGGIKF